MGLLWSDRQEYLKTVQFSSVNLDAHVKSPFHMDLGIKVFRNFELSK